MAETGLQSFTNGVASYLASCVFPLIQQGAAQKGYSVTVEEMLAWTNTPSVRAATPAHVMPAMSHGGTIPLAAAVAPTTSRKVVGSENYQPGVTCGYKYIRGDNKGRYCNKPCAGATYCNSCLKSHKNLAAKAGVAPGVAPGAGAVPGYVGVPPVVVAPAATPAQLSVVEYDAEQGLYKDITYNFIVKQISEGNIVALGKLSDSGAEILPLNAQDQANARALGLTMPATTAPAVPTIPTAQIPAAVPAVHVPVALPAIPSVQVPTIPTIPTVPAGQVPTIPTIPTVQVPTIPTVQVPAIPTIPVAAPAPLPVIPAMTDVAVPQIPQIPQIPQFAVAQA